MGAFNHKFFVLFIFYTWCSSLVCLFLIIFRFFRCGFVMGDDDGSGDDGSGDAAADADVVDAASDALESSGLLASIEGVVGGAIAAYYAYNESSLSTAGTGTGAGAATSMGALEDGYNSIYNNSEAASLATATTGAWDGYSYNESSPLLTEDHDHAWDYSYNESSLHQDAWTEQHDQNRTMRFLEENDSNSRYAYSGCTEIYSVRIIALSIMAFAFLIFTCCMLFEQIDAIESNTSKIARMKMRMGQDEDGEYGKVAQGFNEMFGVGLGSMDANVGLHWFLPMRVQFPEGLRDKVLGFEYCHEWRGKIYQEEDDDEEGGMATASATASRSSSRARGSGASGALMSSDSDDHDDHGGGEIELSRSIDISTTAEETPRVTNRKRGSMKADEDSSEHSAKIV